MRCPESLPNSVEGFSAFRKCEGLQTAQWFCNQEPFIQVKLWALMASRWEPSWMTRMSSDPLTNHRSRPLLCAARSCGDAFVTYASFRKRLNNGSLQNLQNMKAATAA